jgi:hypothetical protein
LAERVLALLEEAPDPEHIPDLDLNTIQVEDIPQAGIAVNIQSPLQEDEPATYRSSGDDIDRYDHRGKLY